MKALFCGMDWFPTCRDGGLDRYFFEGVSALASQGVSGTAMASYVEAGSLGPVAVRSMATRDASLRERWSGAERIAANAIAAGIDVANVHFALYAFPWIRRLPKSVPLVVNFHGPWADEMRVEAQGLKRRLLASVAYWIEQRVYQRANVLITLSEAFRELLHLRYCIPLGAIRVVAGGLDVERFSGAPSRKEARRALGWPMNRPILLAVRRLAKRMGLEALIDSVATLRTQFPEILLLIGGKGPERDALDRRIRMHGVEENVRLLGFIAEDDLPLAYAAADLSVVPTTALEGFGLSTVEALASGTPVMGTPIGGTPEILRPLAHELIFDAPNATAMGSRIAAFLRGDLSLPNREECRKYAERYAWPSVAPQLLDIFHDASRKACEQGPSAKRVPRARV